MSASPRISLASWTALRSADGRGALVAGCFDVSATSWSPEIDELARAKLHETIAGTAVRATGFGDLTITSTRAEGNATLRAYEGRGAAALDARSAQGFVAHDAAPVLSSCFALCADSNTASRCADAVRDAPVDGAYVEPPAPGLGLRAALALVHHPSATGWGGLALLTLAGGLAIATRKRPKRRRLR